MTSRIILILCGLLLISCSSTPGGRNPSAYNYQYNAPLTQEKSIKKVILASSSLGAPTLNHLKAGERRVKAQVRDYLEAAGYEILPDHYFKNAWNQATRTFGQPYDPTNGKIDGMTWRRVMVSTGETLRESSPADAIIFADVIEHESQHSYSMKHYARWFGVTRKPYIQGTGDGVSTDFDWSQSLKVASLQVTIFSSDMERLFSSYGGIQATQGVDTKRSSPAYVRRKKLLKNDDQIEEGIEIAFHPFISMKDYPGKTLEERAAIEAEIVKEKEEKKSRLGY